MEVYITISPIEQKLNKIIRTISTDGDGDEATLLLVFKTFNFAEISVIDLDDAGRECDTRDATALSQTSEPLSVHGTAVGGKILACGFTPSECFEYDVGADQWTPSDVARNEARWKSHVRKKARKLARKYFQIRYVPYGLDIGDQHWVFGGGNKVTSDSTEYYDGEDFVSAFDLPLDTDHTCVVDLLVRSRNNAKFIQCRNRNKLFIFRTGPF